MAVDNPTISHNGDFTVKTFTYSGLDNGDSGTPFVAPLFADKTATVRGTFGSGGNVKIQGSDDGTNFFTMTTNDTTVDLAAVAAAAGFALVENPQYIRPNVTAGDGATDITVVFTCRRQSDART